ncbi:MAG: Lrp/AsnC family transcriptional regulator [Nanoarchaeota archaeon]
MAKSGLTSTERSILRQLESDARMPFSRMSKKIHKSQQRICYAVNSMIKKEIINSFYALVDYSKLDVGSYRLYFKVSYMGKGRFEELIDYLKKEPHTSWIATCGGKYDLICTFLASNPSQFNKSLRRIMEKFPQQIRDYTVLTTIAIREFGRKYLYGDMTNFNEKIIGGDRPPEKIDEIDMKILNYMSEDARISAVKLGEMLSLTPKTIIKRINNLTKTSILRGYKPLINIRKADYASNIILIRYHNISSELEDKFTNYLKMHPNVVNIIKTLGEWDIEIKVETLNHIEFRKIEMEIREEFALIIKHIESIPLYRSYKCNLFPKFLIDNLIN